ncbi:MAG TPA: AAA family ATPase [Saprospiraceae bacterium]|nr:AAA family ATPase [Saprospiraceae bacterium]
MEESIENKSIDHFKFKELKVYCSTEWLAENKKKYRQVFDRYEVKYIYTELSFYNKLFDIDSWDASITLKCYELKARKKLICNLEFKKKISKYDNVVYIREGWGNKKEGIFWKKGTYFWEAYIDDEKVGSKYFYIEDVGYEFVDGSNPYLQVESVKLYEGHLDDVTLEERQYLMVFSSEETRYIHAEIRLNNLLKTYDWHCELFVRFYNDVHELKGQVLRLQLVNKADEIFTIQAGWGSNIKGSWRPGTYTMELIFMDKLIARVPFEVDDFFEIGTPEVELPDQNRLLSKPLDAEAFQTFEEVIERLDRMIGLEDIKTKVREHAQYIQFIRLRKDKGFKERQNINLHSVFTGNPGTGKTTVAKMMGILYKKMGLLSKGHIHEVDRVDLVGEYIGQTAPKVKEAIEKARGGILFIDEAYALARSNDDTKDFGREVIEMLVKEMSNDKGDLAIIVAGYPKEMKYFLDSNPGLRSRFKQYFEFSDYLPQELLDIAIFACHEKEVRLTPEALEEVKKIITNAYRNRDRTFGNARFVYDIIEKSKLQLGLRIMQSNDPDIYSLDELKTLHKEDVEKIQVVEKRMLPDIPIDESLLEIALYELDSLIGIDNVKKQINELVHVVRFYKESGKSVLSSFFLHTVFVGNPGTGKTTVARILTNIFKALGILERGHMVETDRQGLVAGFIGQTAIKTAEKIDEALGGVLFIDEAYSLSNFNGLQGDYGNEAIQTLLKRMEDMRGRFFVFVAGYPSNMESFLKANPGLSSRFDNFLKFEDYSPQQLIEIALKMFNDEGMSLDQEARKFLLEYFDQIYLYRDKYFGNARTVRKLVLEAIKNQNLRLASLSKDKRKELARIITIADVSSAKSVENEFKVFQKKGIGYRSSSSG